MHDILHIKPIAADAHRHTGYLFDNWAYRATYILAVALLVALVIVYRRQLKLKADVKGRRGARASRVATQKLRVAREYMKNHENEKFYAETARALWGYVSDKLGIPASQLLRDNISQQLTDYGASQSTVDEIINVLDQCEMARFTPQHTDSEISELYSNAVNAIKNLEDVKK